jgi:hypothetical protein
MLCPDVLLDLAGLLDLVLLDDADSPAAQQKGGMASNRWCRTIRDLTLPKDHRATYRGGLGHLHRKEVCLQGPQLHVCKQACDSVSSGERGTQKTTLSHISCIFQRYKTTK